MTVSEHGTLQPYVTPQGAQSGSVASMAHDTEYKGTGKASDVDSAAAPDLGYTAVSILSGSCCGAVSSTVYFAENVCIYNAMEALAMLLITGILCSRINNNLIVGHFAFIGLCQLYALLYAADKGLQSQNILQSSDSAAYLLKINLPIVRTYMSVLYMSHCTGDCRMHACSALAYPASKYCGTVWYCCVAVSVYSAYSPGISPLGRDLAVVMNGQIW